MSSSWSNIKECIHAKICVDYTCVLKELMTYDKIYFKAIITDCSQFKLKDKIHFDNCWYIYFNMNGWV